MSWPSTGFGNNSVHAAVIQVIDEISKTNGIRLGDKDAKQLESGFTGFTATDLQNLGTGEAICRVERPEFSFNLTITKPRTIDEAVAKKLHDMVVDASRKQYATPLPDVESELAKSTILEALPPEPKLVMEKKGEGVGETQRAIPPLAPLPAETVYKEISVSEPPKRVMRKVPLEEPSLGRGGAEHKYLQHLIKRFAEGLGFRAEIEGEAMGGAADVALRKGDTSVACEIAITTEDAHELANARKCLAAGFTHVIAVCPDARRRGKLQTLLGRELAESEKAKVQCLSPDDVLALIRELAAKELSEEKTVRGYKVKTSYRAVDAGEEADKRERISGVIAGALKRVTAKKKRHPK